VNAAIAPALQWYQLIFFLSASEAETTSTYDEDIGICITSHYICWVSMELRRDDVQAIFEVLCAGLINANVTDVIRYASTTSRECSFTAISDHTRAFGDYSGRCLIRCLRVPLGSHGRDQPSSL
jgi:hypothetical protein